MIFQLQKSKLILIENQNKNCVIEFSNVLLSKSTLFIKVGLKENEGVKEIVDPLRNPSNESSEHGGSEYNKIK